MKTTLVRYTCLSDIDARNLRDQINAIPKHRSRYIDREGTTIVVPASIPRETVIDEAAALGISITEL